MTNTSLNVEELRDDFSTQSWAERRQHKRYETNWPAHCVAASGKSWNVTIIDASPGGFGLSRNLPVAKLTDLAITIEDIGTFSCTLVWKGKNASGLKLHNPAETLSENQTSDLASGLARIVNKKLKSSAEPMYTATLP